MPNFIREQELLRKSGLSDWYVDLICSVPSILQSINHYFSAAKFVLESMLSDQAKCALFCFESALEVISLFPDAAKVLQKSSIGEKYKCSLFMCQSSLEAISLFPHAAKRLLESTLDDQHKFDLLFSDASLNLQIIQNNPIFSIIALFLDKDNDSATRTHFFKEKLFGRYQYHPLTPAVKYMIRHNLPTEQLVYLLKEPNNLISFTWWVKKLSKQLIDGPSSSDDRSEITTPSRQPYLVSDVLPHITKFLTIPPLPEREAARLHFS